MLYSSTSAVLEYSITAFMFRLPYKISVKFCFELSPVALGFVFHFNMILNLGVSDWKFGEKN